jgi:hypothetical protein
MYVLRFVKDDNFRTIETISRDKANAEYKELCSDPSVTELEACVLTVDVKFTTNGKVYTYFIDTRVNGYKYIKCGEDTLYIVSCKLRTVEELKAMAKSRGFSYCEYKVLHGIAIK